MHLEVPIIASSQRAGGFLAGGQRRMERAKIRTHDLGVIKRRVNFDPGDAPGVERPIRIIDAGGRTVGGGRFERRDRVVVSGDPTTQPAVGPQNPHVGVDQRHPFGHVAKNLERPRYAAELMDLGELVTDDPNPADRRIL